MRIFFVARVLVVVSVALALCGVPCNAQSTDAAVGGQVTDQDGRVVPDVKVVLTNLNTGVVHEAKTNGDGIYDVPALPPGIYRANVTKDGFKSIVKGDIELHVQDVASINFQLQVGSVTETVTVQAEGPVINTTDASVSTVIDRQFVENLPLNGRSFNTLLQLTPGVVIAQISNAEAPGQFSISGQRTDANNFIVDGVSANFGAAASSFQGQSGTGTSQAFSALGGTSSLASVEALQEFRIETSSFAPEFGNAPGGQIILTTRSGTNDFHGGVYDYFRNTAMDANDWFANQAGLPRAPEHHNDFGGFLGGPIWKDRTFFFFSYEGARLDLPQTTIVLVPSVGARSMVPTLAPFLNAYPLPNGPINAADPDAAQFTGSYPNRATLNATSIRIDHTFNGRFSIFGRYNDAPSQLIQRVGSLSTLQSTEVNTQTLTVGLTMLLSSTLLNALRGNYSMQYSALSDRLDSFGGAVPLSPSLLLGSLPSANNFAAFQTFDIGALSTGPQARNRTRQLNLVDDLTLTTGPHELKFGIDYRALFLNAASPNYGVSFSSPTVQGFLASGSGNVFTAAAIPVRLLTNSLSLYAQDRWKLSPRLTLTYGLRWELSPAPSPRGATTLAAWENVGSPSQITLAPPGTPVWSTTYGNFAPRIGMAYALTEGGHFVLRAGAGIFYDAGVGAAANMAGSFPNYVTGFFPGVPVPISSATPYLPVISLSPPYPDGIFAFAPNLRLPRSYQWNIALEKSFAGGQMISATYLGQAGRDLLREGAFYQPNSSFQGEFLLTQNDARSNYNALQLQYRRPISKRIQALLNYTWSHSLDNASNDVVAGLTNTVISAANDYASSGFDVRQSFSGALTYAVPSATKSGPLFLLTRDWSIATVAVARTGFPFNAIVFSTSPDPEGFASSRPDLVPGQPFWISDSSAPGGKILNLAAFALPSTVRQGTEERNDIPGFGLTQVDFAISRKFPISERISVHLRADAFNLFNHPNFTNPGAYIEFGPTYLRSTEMLNQGLGGLNPLFQEGGPRSLQVSLKLVF
ncbi:MAG: TonB-dependent receptor [Candidatus Acidiferrales bacterium]